MSDDDMSSIPDAMMDHPMWDPLVDLVALAATYDQRKAGPLDVKAWFLVAEIERWDLAAVQRIIVEHYARTADRLSPAAVSQRLRAIRRVAAETFEDPVLPDDFGGLTYPQWYRARRAEHVERCLRSWTATGQEPRHGAIEANRIGSVAELIAAAPVAVHDAVADAARKIERRRA